MPGALGKRHELDDCAITPNEKMRGYRHATDFSEVRVRVPVELVFEERFDFRAAKFSGRQADAMQDHRVEQRSGWTRIAIGTEALSCRLNQTRRRIDGIVASHGF